MDTIHGDIYSGNCYYAYTHVAHEGGFDLAAFSAVRAWLARVAAEPAHVTMDEFAPTRD